MKKSDSTGKASAPDVVEEVKLTFAKGASLSDPGKLFNASLEGNARRAIVSGREHMTNLPSHRAVAACAIILATIAGAAAAHAESDADFRARVDAFVDEWHADAAHARPAYFDKIAPDGIYIGTDKTERWTRDAFKAWAGRFFERPSAWSFTPRHRNVAFTPDRSVVWFDEQLESAMGVLQATGVMRVTGDGFAIVHYQLSIAVPNEVQPQVSSLIEEFSAR